MPVACDDVDGARRKAHLGRQLGHAQQAQAGVLGGFDHAHIARRQRAAHAAAKNLHRVVPGNDMACHAVWLAPGQHAVARRAGNGLAVQLVAGPGIELEIAGQRLHIGTGLACGLAAVALLQRRQFVRMLQHGGRQAHQQPPTLGSGQLVPHGIQALACSVHRMVDVLRIAALQGVEGLSIGRIDHGQRAAAGGCEGSVGDEIELHERIVRQMVLCVK